MPRPPGRHQEDGHHLEPTRSKGTGLGSLEVSHLQPMPVIGLSAYVTTTQWSTVIFNYCQVPVFLFDLITIKSFI